MEKETNYLLLVVSYAPKNENLIQELKENKPIKIYRGYWSKVLKLDLKTVQPLTVEEVIALGLLA